MTPTLLSIVDRTAYFSHGVERELPEGIEADEYLPQDEALGPFPKWKVQIAYGTKRGGLLLSLGDSLERFDQAVKYLDHRRRR